MNDNQIILDNLRKARAIIAAAPEHEFDLGYFKRVKHQAPSCGTLMCSLGWIASSPEFSGRISLKLNLDPSKFNELHGEDVYVPFLPHDPHVGTAAVLKHLDTVFGTNAYERLFEPRSTGSFDAMHPNALLAPQTSDDDEPLVYEIRDTTDKELALWRIDRQIALYEQPTNP